MNSPAQIGFYNSLFGAEAPYSNEYSMNFDGIDETFTGVRNASYYNTSKVSISIWFKCTTNASSPMIYSTGRQYIRLISSNRIRFWCYNPPAIQDNLIVTAPTTYTDGNWHHILAVIDTSASVQEVFYDGASIGSQVPSGSSLYAELTFAVGSNQGVSGFFEGNIDEVARWHDTDMSASISDIYNGGTPSDLNSLPTQPTNWWRMGEHGTWNVSSWDLVTQGIDTATDIRSLNMEEADRQTDTP